MEPRMPKPRKRGIVRRPRIRAPIRCPQCLLTTVSPVMCDHCSHPLREPVSEGRMTDAIRWKASHPMQWDWIQRNADVSAFARSLRDTALPEFGKPTDKQQAVLDRITRGNP